MKSLWLALCLPFASFAAPTWLVTKVSDGDTYHLQPSDGSKLIKLRLAGVDTPEKSANAKFKRDMVRIRLALGSMAPSDQQMLTLGKTATRKVRDQIMGKQVTLTLTPEGQDRYGRSLGYITLADGTDLGASLIRDGLACAYVKYPHPRQKSYLDLESKGVAVSTTPLRRAVQEQCK